MNEGKKTLPVLKKLKLIALMAVLVIATAEVTIRISEDFTYSTFVFRKYDPELGTALIPLAAGRHSSCYEGYVAVNEHGMRDRSRSIEKPSGVFRIGVFGDSIMEAVQVAPEQTSTYLLEQRLNRDLCDGHCEVLNFSVGSYSTVQEYLKYEKLGRRFDLDLVLVVTDPNDIIANVEPGHIMAGSFYYAPHLVRVGDKFEITQPRPLGPSMRAFTTLARHSGIALYGGKFYYHVVEPFFQWLGNGSDEWSTDPEFVLYDAASSTAKIAWDALDDVLRRFRSAAGRDGARFAVAYRTNDDRNPPRQVARSAVPARFVADMGRRQFARFGNETGTPMLDLGRHLREYIRATKLEWPFLSYTCNNHYNPQGHRVIADALFSFIQTRGLIEPAVGGPAHASRRRSK